MALSLLEDGRVEQASLVFRVDDLLDEWGEVSLVLSSSRQGREAGTSRRVKCV